MAESLSESEDEQTLSNQLATLKKEVNDLHQALNAAIKCICMMEWGHGSKCRETLKTLLNNVDEKQMINYLVEHGHSLTENGSHTVCGIYHCALDTPIKTRIFDTNKDEYYQYGQLHRENGPAYIEYNSYGVKVRKEIYYIEGKKSNRNGPAVIEYNNEGAITCTEYWIDGVLGHPDPNHYSIHQFIAAGYISNEYWEASYCKNGKIVKREHFNRECQMIKQVLYDENSGDVIQSTTWSRK